MNFSFSIVDNPVPAPSAALHTVYRLHADPSYDVRKRGVQNDDLVALRTDEGLGRVLIEGCEELEATPGTLLFFRHDKVRRYWCADETWNFWWFEFAGGDLPGVPLNKPLRVDAVEREEENCMACLETLGKADMGAARLASAIFSLLLSGWLLQAGVRKPASPYREAINRMIDAMKRNMSQPLSVESLAHGAGLSERRFRQVFLIETGKKPKQFIEELRLKMAEEMLKSTPLSIGEIALRLGYSSQFHFSKAFRAAHGLPPSHFRAGKSCKL